MSTYLIIDILTLSLPLLLSFDKKVHFYKRWQFLFPAMAVTMIVFIPWDIIFTARGVWGFNSMHLTGINIFNLPLEEWLFFISVPYASVFIYDVFRAYLKKSPLESYTKGISLFLIAFLILMALLSYDKAYTFITFIFLAAMIVFLQFIKHVNYLGWFYFSYSVTLIPFLVVNGILTGSIIHEEVVWYNNDHNLSVRFLTIPIEDIFYGMLLILLNVGLYEWFMKRKNIRA